MPTTRKPCVPIQVAQVRQKVFASERICYTCKLTEVFIIQTSKGFFVICIRQKKKKKGNPTLIVEEFRCLWTLCSLIVREGNFVQENASNFFQLLPFKDLLENEKSHVREVKILWGEGELFKTVAEPI